MTTPPLEASPPLLAPTLEETRALNNAYSEEEIRSLAQQLQKSGELGFDPTTILKGIVTEIGVTSSPPTVSIQISGDTTTTISGVRLMSHYSPVVGDTVLVAKQGADIVVLGHIADTSAISATSPTGNGWVTATLAAGSHDGNGNGDVQYRRILDHGSWKMQWRGGWNVSGTTLVSTLATEYRPSSRRTLVVARNASGSNDVKFDFNTNGSVGLVGTNTSPNSATGSGDVFFRDLNSGTGSATTSSTVSHSHGGAVASSTITHNDGSHSHSISVDHDHGFSGGSHSHTVNSPTWVSLNGVEYFL